MSDATPYDELVARYVETGELADDLRAKLTPDEQRALEDALPDLDLVRLELGDPAAWAEPPADLEGRIIDAVRSEATAPRATAPTAAPAGPDPLRAPPAPGRTGEGTVVATANVRARRAVAVAVAASLVAAAAVVVAILGFASRSSGPTGDSAAPPATTPPSGPVTIGAGVEAKLKGTELAPGAAGTVRLDETASGVWIRLNASGLPRRDDGQFYEAWAKTPQGLVPVGTFHTGDKVVLWSGVAIDDTDAITVTLEDNDGNQESSGRRVLLATIPHAGSSAPPATGAGGSTPR